MTFLVVSIVLLASIYLIKVLYLFYNNSKVKIAKRNSKAAQINSKVVELIRKDRQANSKAVEINCIGRQANSKAVEINRICPQANSKFSGKSDKIYKQSNLITIPEKHYDSSAFYELVYIFLSEQQLLGKEVNPEELCEGIVIGSGTDKQYVKVFIEQEIMNYSDVRLFLQEAREFSCWRCTLFIDGYLVNDAWKLVKKAGVKVYEKNDLRSYFKVRYENDRSDSFVWEDEDAYDIEWDVYNESRCPLCKSFNVFFKQSKFSIASTACGYKKYGILNAALEESEISDQEWECRSCGHSW